VERGQIDKAAAEMRPMTVPQVIDVVKHEIEHIVRLHPGRHGARDHDLMNIAADMAIHGHKKSGRFPNMPIDVFFLPDDMSEELTAEEIYEALYQKHGGGKGKVGKGGNGNGKPLPDGHLCDDHSIWDGSEASEDEARQVVKDMVDRASKMAGQQPGHLKKAIEELEEPQILWKYLLRQWLGRQAGGRRSTWARINRRHQTFGVKGHSCHARTKLTIWADLSGSVWGNVKMVEQFFSEIEAASHAYEVTIVMFDYSIQSVERYHRGGWRNIEPKGGGGTRFIFADMADEYKSKNGLFGQINVVLTDGYAEFPDKEIAPFIWAIVSTDVEPPKHIKAIHIK
jgi:predicted metal-dependent peptidase